MDNSLSSKGYPLRIFVCFTGINSLAFGIALCRVAAVGVDPFTAINIGLGSIFGLSLGAFQLVLNIILAVLVYFVDRNLVGVGTLMNMVLVGFLIDIYSNLIQLLGIFSADVVSVALFLVAGVLFFTFGLALYLFPGLGLAPYDAITVIIEVRSRCSYRASRIAQDASVTLLAFFVGAPIGVFTVVAALLAGPLITLWTEKALEPFFSKIPSATLPLREK